MLEFKNGQLEENKGKIIQRFKTENGSVTLNGPILANFKQMSERLIIKDMNKCMAVILMFNMF